MIVSSDSKLFEDFKVHFLYLKRLGYLGAPCQTRAGQKPAADSLEHIKESIRDCCKCSLYTTRKNIVFGEGLSTARLVLVFDSPSLDQDAMGAPFAGAEGELLVRMLKAIDLTPAQVYTTFILKCRSQAGSAGPDEFAACLPFLKGQLTAIQPNLICALGEGAIQLLARTQAPIAELRGKFHDYDGINVLATHHPAQLLGNDEKKREAWADLQKLRSRLLG